jgi:hypothetical protein
MTPEEVAPPFENWDQHLKALDEPSLRQLARDYGWLDGEARAQEEGPEFHRRREAVIAECRRRGLSRG